MALSLSAYAEDKIDKSAQVEKKQDNKKIEPSNAGKKQIVRLEELKKEFDQANQVIMKEAVDLEKETAQKMKEMETLSESLQPKLAKAQKIEDAFERDLVIRLLKNEFENNFKALEKELADCQRRHGEFTEKITAVEKSHLKKLALAMEQYARDSAKDDEKNIKDLKALEKELQELLPGQKIKLVE